MLFFAFFGGNFCLGSESWGGALDEIREDELGARGVSSVFIAVSKFVTLGLAVIGESTGGKLDDRADTAEKKGWSNSLPGLSYALGMAGTGGTSASVGAVPDVSIRGFGVGKRDEFKFCDSLALKDAELRTEEV